MANVELHFTGKSLAVCLGLSLPPSLSSCDGHQQEDWSAIHEKICGLVSALHSTGPHTSTSEERVHHDHQQTLRKRHIVGLALQEGQRLLYSGHASLAIPAALQV